MADDYVNDLRDLAGRDVVDPEGDKVGTVTSIYVDDESGEPSWLAVKTGWFGSNISFVPFEGAYVGGDDVVVTYDKDTIKGSPNFDADGHLTPEQEAGLYAHYGRIAGGHVDRAVDSDPAGRNVTPGSVDDAMTRSEEELEVSKRRTATSRVRLRKWVETEYVQMTVPIRREKARLVTEPIGDGSRGEALDEADLREADHEVILSEEEVDIQKRVVPRERVRLEKVVETDEIPVDETVRKERIEMDRNDTR